MYLDIRRAAREARYFPTPRDRKRIYEILHAPVQFDADSKRGDLRHDRQRVVREDCFSPRVLNQEPCSQGSHPTRVYVQIGLDEGLGAYARCLRRAAFADR